MLAGLIVGAGLGLEGGASTIAMPALALQTFVTVGGIPRRRGDEGLREGLKLVALHYTVATLPLVAVAALVGLDEPLGVGFLLVAIAPPAALIPAIAGRLELDVRSTLVFVLAAYMVALVFTPAVLALVLGTTVGFAGIATTVGLGLIAPTVLGRLLHEQIVRVPEGVRRGIVNVAVFFITLGLGGEIVDGLSAAGLGVVGLALVALVLAARNVGSGWLAGRLAGPGLAMEGTLSGGFKNVALAAAVGGALVGPVAAVPGLMGFLVDTAYMLFLARQASRAPPGGA